MARTPLFPRGSDFTAWALAVTQRIERDYAELKNDEQTIQARIESLSADVALSLRSLSVCLEADITTAFNNARTDFLSNDASLSAVLAANDASIVAQVAVDLRSLSSVIKADIDSVSFAIKLDISSVAADIVAGLYGGAVFDSDLRSLSDVIKTDISSVSAAIQSSINSISNTVSAMAAIIHGSLSTAEAFVHGSLSSLEAMHTSLSTAEAFVRGSLSTLETMHTSLSTAELFVRGSLSTLETMHTSLSTAELFVRGSLSSVEAFVRGSLSNTISVIAALFVNPKSAPYNAVGDGIADDTAALKAALIAAKNKTLLIPAGTYRLQGQLTLTGGILIQGAGQGSTQLRWTSSATTEGIYICASAGQAQEFHTVRDLTLLTGKANTGTALTFDYTNQIVTISASLIVTMDRLRIRGFVENVECMGINTISSGSATTDGWNTGILSIAAINMNYHACTVVGQAADGVHAVAGSYGIRSYGNPATGTTENGHPVVFVHDKCVLQYCGIGIDAINCEGIFIQNCQAVACNYGYHAQSEGYNAPQFTLIGSHGNCYNSAVFVDGMSQIYIGGNLFYQVQTAPAGNWPIVIQNVTFGGIVGNTITAIGSNTTTAAVDIINSAYLSISDNVFIGPYLLNGLVMEATSSKCKGSNNIGYNLGAKTVSDGGTDNHINEKVAAGTRLRAISLTQGQAVTISFSEAFENAIDSVVANGVNTGAFNLNDDWLTINSFSLGGFVVRYNTGSITGDRTIHFMAFGR